MRILAGFGILLVSAAMWLSAQSKQVQSKQKKAAPKSVLPPPAAAPKSPIADPKSEAAPPGPLLIAPTTERLTYSVEWRLIHAGSVTAELKSNWGQLKMESAGLVSKLYKIEDTYSTSYDDGYCATASVMDAMEGKRHRETRVQYDRAQNHAFFTERDVLNNSVIRHADVAVPYCVHDVVGALLALQGKNVEPGQTLDLPVSDGQRFAQVRMDALEREEVKTPLGSFKTIRVEAALLNGVVYSRKGRLFLWVTDDARRLPVQIQLKMSFPIGTVTLGLEKEEHL
jgi:hypothetical protein